MIRYARAPSARLRALLSPGGWLSGLLDRNAAAQLPLPADVHLRERDRVHVYCGLTRLIDVALRGDEVVVRAHRTYSSQTCASDLLRRWSTSESGFAEGIRRYFSAVRIGTTHVRAEGTVQATWAAVTEPWLPFDREAVLGYENKIAQTIARAAESIRSARAAVAEFVAGDSQDWTTPGTRKVSAELDQLAVDPRGHLVLLELKHGRAAGASVYYSPLQLLQYVHEWAPAFDGVRADLQALIEARQAIGLSPPGMPELNGELRPVIAFGRDLPSDEVWRRFELVRAIANHYLPRGVPPIEVWNVTDLGTPHRIA